jgi:hypothetical protein
VQPGRTKRIIQWYLQVDGYCGLNRDLHVH